MKHGKFTAGFAKNLGQKLEKEGYTVWYDHGDPAEDSHVLKTSGYYGDKLSNQTKLAETDIMITKRDNIRCLVEIEETQVSPKKILGNAATICMCNGFAINRKGTHERYLFDDETKLLIACWFKKEGKGAEKMERLERRFKQFKGWEEGLLVENVIFVHSDSLNTLLVDLEKRILSILNLKV